MAACWHCGKRLAEGVRICPFCRADQTTPGQKPQAARTLEQIRRGQPASRWRLNMGGGQQTSRLWILLLLIALAGGLAIWVLRPARPDLAALQPADPTAPFPCSGQRRCLVVYLAPWAPATDRTVAVLKQVAADWADSSDLGLAAVVGADDPEAMDRLIATLPVPALRDADDAFARRMDVETVPTWWVLDAAGAVAERVDGTYLPYEYHMERLGLR
ncbi:MAG: hypothetical protein KC549_01715 [Myxococcales bacterium]|nr:hypothetical protein [Myxococcales bacterium]MCB9549840.1 hypothetical protein [Myxococcales bacterium]